MTKQGEQLLDTHTYIDAYITLASRRETVNRGNWVEDAWLLYGAMEGETAFSSHSENPITLSGSIVMTLLHCHATPSSTKLCLCR